MKKVLSILAIIMLISLVVCVSVYASEFSITSTEDLGGAEDALQTMGSKVFTFITYIGMALAVIVLAVLGVKYMMGSTEEKAEYKKSMMPYLIGAVLIFGASAISGMVIDFGQSITGSESESGESET